MEQQQPSPPALLDANGLSQAAGCSSVRAATVPAAPACEPATELLDLPGALLAQILRLLKGHTGLKPVLCCARALQACPGKRCLKPHACMHAMLAQLPCALACMQRPMRC
jgi:hypothetical protein